MERNIYTPYNWLGSVIMFFIDCMIFGWAWGWLAWGWQMIWIPLFAAGVINGLGHWWGYRNGTTRDQSRNISPWGIVVGGEELHNNHHLDPGSAKLSLKPWEFDIGWMYIKLLEKAKLAKLRVANS
jgi:stearoyl-CoA desaturase (delta-9 desaturase)